MSPGEVPTGNPLFLKAIANYQGAEFVDLVFARGLSVSFLIYLRKLLGEISHLVFVGGFTQEANHHFIYFSNSNGKIK